MEREEKRYYLDDDELDLVHDEYDAEELLYSKGIEAEDVSFDGKDTIRYYVEAEYDSDDVERGWNESYLNSIGMSMRDFV